MAEPKLITRWRLIRVISRSLGRKWAGCLSFDEGSDVMTTSPIASVEGDVVTTRSGSRYRLAGDISGLALLPFYLTDGTPYPPGATVDAVPPDHGASLAELIAFYGESALIGIYEDGDYATFYPYDEAWAFRYVHARGGKLYRNGVEVSDAR